ncbi:Phage antirepressor protein [hydrothermal vent metagenome]|uniref:Phage antirepressor protein n=1 Tax=hydrothermal vent metagenome TaxID=652676 RepID=A0A1W1BPX3_9ZZZZ
MFNVAKIAGKLNSNGVLPDGCIITLKEITDLLGVQHSKALEKVIKLSKEPSFGTVSKMDFVYNNKGQTIQTLAFTKKQAIAVAARLDNTMLMQVIDKVEELEKQNKVRVPQTLSEALLLASKQAEVIEKQNLALESKSQTIRNVVHSENTYTASQVAKDMENPISARLLNKMLSEAGVIFKQNGSWQLYEKYAGHNLTSLKETKPDEQGKTFHSLRWTALGKNWIYKNWTKVKQRVSMETLSEWELKITNDLPEIPMPRKKDRNF